MARVTLIGQKKMNKVISHEPGVIASVRSQAQRIGSKAEARLASHRHSGHASISITYGETDSFVNLDDEAALSIEFGHGLVHFGKRTNVNIPGLYIITGAAGLV